MLHVLCWGLLLGWGHPAQACGTLPENDWKHVYTDVDATFNLLNWAITCGESVGVRFIDTCDGAYSILSLLQL
jgi:hypothetical protein